MSSFRKIYEIIPTSAIVHRYFSTKNVNRQVKILGKLLGEKVSGTKKRWYPHQEILTSSKITSTKQGKNSSRRINVLNKLFMRHITDLLATGEASEKIIGKGLEITKVKVAPDFQGVNAYWIVKTDVKDSEMETMLNECSGKLRHELSQLRLMGEVPKIRFIKDKMYVNLTQVENILKKCDFGENCKANSWKTSDLSDFVGNEYDISQEMINRHDEAISEVLPRMRHDVFGIQHKEILEKITTKMKKSKQAWDLYNQNVLCSSEELEKETTKNIRKYLEENNSAEFEKFLKRKTYSKSTPDRKSSFSYTDYMVKEINEDICDYNEDADYIEEYEKK